MELQTIIDIRKESFDIVPKDRLLFVGSCFADNIGRRFVDNRFRAVVNPFGVMYNPVSILHTIERVTKDEYGSDMNDKIASGDPLVAVFTLGTNHIYILKETGEVVDNCQKRPQSLFEEMELTVDECASYLTEAIYLLQQAYSNVRVILTVSPIRYAKYGFHGSQLSKATLQLAADKVVRTMSGEKSLRCGDVSSMVTVSYFPAYEIMNDELRDYRFYAPDMLHPSSQAVDYIYDRFKDMFFGKETRHFEAEWQPIRSALNHRPFNPDADEYKSFLAKAKEDEQNFVVKWFGSENR